jgi:PKD repeat protein
MKIVLSLICLIFYQALYAQPNVDFSATPIEVCLGSSIQFNDLTTSTNPIQTWLWNFGDGQESSLQNPTHTYTFSGTFTVTLLVNDGVGTFAEQKVGYVTVHPLPVVGFNMETVGCELPFTPTFSNISPGSGAYSYDWQFGNGQSSSSLIPTGITYTSTGEYTVSLTVTNTTTGCVNSLAQTISIFEFQTDYVPIGGTYCQNEVISFSDVSTAGVNFWSWDFGGVGSSSIQNPSFSFASPGVYAVNLISGNSTNGCSDESVYSFEILPLPIPSFTATPITGCAPLAVDFTNTTGVTGNYSWNFGNSTSSSEENPPTVTYVANGTYSVSLALTDANGCSNTVLLSDYITVSPLIPQFEADVTDGCEALTVQFTDLSVVPNASADPIVNWEWNFGNGNTFTGQNPPPQIYNEGVYDVTLTITSSSGCTETLVQSQYIQVGVPPVVDFTYTPLNDCAKNEWNFTNNSVIPVLHDPNDVIYSWNFGDGGTSALENPTYTYPIDTGYFDVTLTVEFRGCMDSLIVPQAVYVRAPISQFSPSEMVFCNPVLPLEVEFTDNSIIGNPDIPDDVEMIWKWGDGTTTTLLGAELYDSDQGSMSHTYTSYGTFTIEQVIYNYTTGCEDSTTQTISISAIDAGFTLSTDSVCVFSEFSIVEGINPALNTHSIVSVAYDMGDDSTLITFNPNYAYTNSGTFTITQTVVNAVGCQDNTSLPIVVLALPLAQITPSEFAGCEPFLVTFTNSSAIQGNGVDLDTFYWTFENGSTQTTSNLNQTTSYTFTGEGTYFTTLQVEDVFGCLSNPTTIPSTITKPEAIFSVPPVVCNFSEFNALNGSLDFVNAQWSVDGNIVSSSNDLAFQFNDPQVAGVLSQNHLITLVVTDINGCTDEESISLLVSIPFANADYDLTTTNLDCPPVTINFFDNSTSIGEINSWSWSFGDGNSSVLENPANIYLLSGTYSTSMTITDEYGCTDDTTFVDFVTIGGPQAIVDWELIGDVCNPEYQFTATNTGNLTTITWSLGDGTTVNNSISFTHTYTSQGVYTPTVLLSDGNGCVVPITLNPIGVISNDINALFTANPVPAIIGQSITFVDQSTGGSGSGIVNWFWDMSNATYNNSSNANVEHSYQNGGVYVVSLTVVDNLGCTDTYSLEIPVTAEVVVPNVFTVNGDGANEYFTLLYDAYKSFNVVILNRWGNVVYEGKDLTGIQLWNGYNKSTGNLCTEGVYFYKIDGILFDDQPMSKQGFVTLITGN